jgi:hypothetical protein
MLRHERRLSLSETDVKIFFVGLAPSTEDDEALPIDPPTPATR